MSIPLAALPPEAMHKSQRVPVDHESQVGEARRTATAFAAAFGLDEVEVGKFAIIASEAATNIVKHAGGGELLLRALADGRSGVELLAIDKGSGIPDLPAAMRDGFSTRGTQGQGLGAMSRQASYFDVLSAPGAGTIVLARIIRRVRTTNPDVETGVVCVPMPGETACGDDWACDALSGAMRLVVADGLGHGPLAEAASANATRVFRDAANESVPQALERVHLALKGGRGAAVAIAHLDATRGSIEFAGVGNVAGVVRDALQSRSMVSHNGTAGHVARRFTSFTYEWPEHAIVILASDGIGTRLDLDRYPGLLRRHPALIAALIYRDFSRGRDDATVVVCRRAAELNT